MPSTYRINQDGEPLATVSGLAELELFGEDALPGVYDVDVIHSEPVDGHTSWRWGTLTKFIHGIVRIEADPKENGQG